MGDRAARWLLAGLGVACVGIGAVGVAVPGLPTTIFLLIASVCFAKSCPWLEDRLIRTRLFAPYVRYLDRRTPMPVRAKVWTVALMWMFAGTSAVLLAMRGDAAWIAAGVAVAVLAGVGTVMVVRWRPRAESVA